MKDTSSNSLLWIVAAGLFMQSLDATILNTALPAIAVSLHRSPLALHPVVIAYSLTLAVLTPASGWLADRIGTQRVFLSAIVLFTLGSICCALSNTLHELVSARILQGVGGAMLMPVGRLALLRAFSRDRYLSALAFVSIAAQAAPLVGPALGGWIVQIASWPWIFLINVPLGLVGCFAILRVMPKGLPAEPPAAFDAVGFALLAIAMACFFLGLEPPFIAIARGWWVVCFFAIAAAGVLAYRAYAAQRVRVLFPLALFEDRSYRIGLVGNLVSRVGSSAIPFLLPLLFQLQLGYSPANAGMMLIPLAICGIVCKRVVAPMVRRFGYVRFLFVNTIVLGLAIVSFAAIAPGWPVPLTIVQLCVFGAVNSMQFAAMNSVTLKDVPHRFISSGNSLFSMVQMLAMALGVAVAGTLVPLFSSLASWTSHATDAASLNGFRLAFLTVGIITLIAARVFTRLDEEPVQKEAAV